MSYTEYFNSFVQDQNNISFWYPKIRACGMLVPKTKIFQVPEEITKAFFMDGDQEKNIDTIYNWVKDEVMPKLPQELSNLIFIKNGTFSNKFDFKTCAIRANAVEITSSLIEINYTSLVMGAGGISEFAIRERIKFNSVARPCIYNGMPLRNEYRVFYDFDNQKPLYIVNYWDYDYCNDDISRKATDRIIYEATYPTILAQYEKNKNYVTEKVADYMKNVRGLSGIWSVDVLEDDMGYLWLIDMAIGNRSAYWDPKKAGVEDVDN